MRADGTDLWGPSGGSRSGVPGGPHPGGSGERGSGGLGELSDLGVTEDLVTGEGVVLDLRPASFVTRALALLLDLALLLVVGIVLTWMLGVVVSSTDSAAGSAVALVAFLLIILGLPVAVETMSRGRSLGKLAAGLRVVRDDGGPVRFRHALIRGLLAVFEIYLVWGSIALITSLANRRGKRLGDLLAGTYVIRERTPRDGRPAAVMPSALTGWAAGADLGRIPDRLALAVRQFLSRAPRLHPSSRQRLGVQLADQIARYVAPAPPPGTHPEAFLAAVLAERRRRDEDRLRREESARAARDARRHSASPLSPTGTRLIGDPPPAPAPVPAPVPAPAPPHIPS